MDPDRIGGQGRTCPTCNTLVSTPFCPTCGEHVLHTRELTLRGLFDQLFEAFTHIDSRLIRSIRYLVSRPGALTVACLKGQRKPYIGPVPLFLLANVLFCPRARCFIATPTTAEPASQSGTGPIPFR